MFYGETDTRKRLQNTSTGNSNDNTSSGVSPTGWMRRFHIRDKHIDSGDAIPANYLGKQISSQHLFSERSSLSRGKTELNRR